jgi:virginiamycin B lyase
MRESIMELRRHIGTKARFSSLAARCFISAAARRRTSPQLESLESRHLLSAVSELLVKTSAGPAGIAAGPGNSLWFTEFDADKIGVVDATSHAITEYSVPTNNAQPLAITRGPDGNMWFTESGVGKIGMIDVTTHQVTEYPLSSYYAFPDGITSGPNNTIWFTEEASNQIGMIDVSTGKVTEFPIPTVDSVPEGITLGPDGKIWFTESLGNQIGTIDPTTHAISEYVGLTTGSQPDGIAVGADGNLWFTENAGNRIGMIDPTSHAVSEFVVPTASSRPDGIIAGPNGKLWFTEYAGNKVGSIDPTTHQISQVSIPSSGSTPIGIAAGPHNSVWFAERHSGNLGIVSPSLHVVVVGAPFSSISAGSAFGVSVQVEDDSNTIDTDYSGPVTLSLATAPAGGALGGTISANATGGVASFAGITLNQGGSYTIQVSTSGAAPAIFAVPTVVAPVTLPPITSPIVAPPPEIIAEQILTKGKGKHQSIVGFKLIFSAPLAAATAQNATNYVISQNMRRGRALVAQSIRVRAGYNPSTNSVSLLLVGKPRFMKGGRLLVKATGPTGITGATGVQFDGSATGAPGTNGIFQILPRMRSITR